MYRYRVVFAAEAGTGGATPPVSAVIATPPVSGTPASALPPPPAPPAPTTFSVDLATATPEQRELFTKKGYDKNPNGLLASYYDANKLLSGATDIVAIPGPDAPVELVQRYNKAMGIPEKADDYKFEYPQGFTPDADTEKFGRSFFHKIGIPQSKIPAALEMWNGFAADQHRLAGERSTQANVEQITAMRGGMNEAQWNKTVADGQTAFKALSLPPEVHAALEKNVGAAAVVHLFAALGSKMGEGTLRVPDAGSGGPPPVNTLTAEQARQEIAKLDTDADFQKKYTNNQHAEHPNAVRRMTELYAAAYPRR